MEFLVLGPLVAVSDEAVPLELGTPKARAVLAVLLCRPGRVVGLDAMVDALWPENPPAAAVKNIQLYVHQLRRTLGDAGRIGRDGSGYGLAAEHDEIDAERFTRLVERHEAAVADGDLEQARALLAQALGLWRAEQAYAGIGDVPPVMAESRRLAEARLAALGSRIDIDFQLGRHGELVPELTALTEEHPLHERFWAQLITALHQSGRAADALAAYGRARRIIAEQTGLDPGPELRDLQQAILDRAGPSPRRRKAITEAALPGTPPRMLPPDVGDFTGRRSELAAITAELAGQPDGVTDPDGALPVAALSGQGGVGKTALAVRAAHALADAYPDGQLFAALAGAQPASADPAEILARFLRALGLPGRAVPGTGEERGALYRSLVAGRRVLVVLDDAADEAQIRPLLPGTTSCAVIVTSRIRLGGLSGARHIDLAPLPAQDGYRLLARIAGPARAASDTDAARDLVRLCAGLPLALRVAGSRLASRPHWAMADLAIQLADERKRLDTLRHRDLEVRASFALSYHALGPAEQRLFRFLGLLQAPDVTRWTAAALLDTTVADAAELLDILADARLLDATGPDEAGQHRYRCHDLVRLYAQELAEAHETASARATALGRVFAMLLSLTDAVHRASEGGDFSIIVGDAPRWRSAEVAAAAAAAGTPLALLRAERLSLVAAVRQAVALGLDEACWELAAGGVSLYQAGYYYDDWHETHQLALAMTEAAGNRRGHAMILLLFGSYHAARRQRAMFETYADRALSLFELTGERYGYALAMRRSSDYERHAGHFGRAIARAQEARDLLIALGDPLAAADCLVSAGMACFESGDPSAAADVLRRAVAESRDLGIPVLIAHGSYWLTLAHLGLGQHREAATAVAELSRLVCTVALQVGAVYACHARGNLALATGDLANARLEFQTGLAVARELLDPLMQVRILTDLGELCLAEHRPAEAVATLTEAVATGKDLDYPHPRTRALRRLGDSLAAAGNHDRARAAWTEAAAISAGMRSGDTSRPEPMDWTPTAECLSTYSHPHPRHPTRKGNPRRWCRRGTLSACCRRSASGCSSSRRR